MNSLWNPINLKNNIVLGWGEFVERNISNTIIPATRRKQGQSRDIEVLRVSGQLKGEDFAASAKEARSAVLGWASNKRRAGGKFPQEAWAHQEFELMAGGRNSSAVRIETSDVDFWALRVEVPDENVAGRVWTTEYVIGGSKEDRPRLSLRLIATTAEPELLIEHHVPGPVLSMVSKPGLLRSGRDLNDHPRKIQTLNDAEDLCDHLEDPLRRLPVIVVSLPEGDESLPLINDEELARAVAGISRVVRIRAELTWILTNRFGKARSVFDGSVRVYLPSFSSADNP